MIIICSNEGGAKMKQDVNFNSLSVGLSLLHLHFRYERSM